MSGKVLEFAPRPRRTATRRRKPTALAGTPIAALIPSWELALQSANKSKSTIEGYLRLVRRFAAFLEADDGLPKDAETVTADEVRAFIVAQKDSKGLPTAKAAHAYLNVFFNWVIAEGERTTFSPVLRADEPHVPKKARKYLTLDEVAALLDVCKGADFLSRRDAAVIRVFIDCGVRLSGLCGIRLEDVDLKGRRIRITLKGGNEHWVPIGAKTAQAIDRYLRTRARHPAADSPWLWLGTTNHAKGLTNGGVQEMLHRRGEQAGVDNVHPHRFRGSSAHHQLAAGASPDAVRRVLGWKSEVMLRHYTEELADERAREVHARVSPSDRI